MSRVESIKAEFVEFVPGMLQPGVLYVSRKYQTASHLCGCGCGNKVVTPLKPGGWRLSTSKSRVTLYPSIGNWSFPCKSHYWIRDDRILWAPQMSQEEIDEVRVRDQQDRQRYFDAASRKTSLWQKILRRLSF